MTKKKKLFWQIPVLLILGLTAVEFWYPGRVTNLPLVREVKVRWYAGRLGNDDPEIQASAAHALGLMGPKARRAVPALIAALDSSRSEVRDAAAWALGNIGPDAEAAVQPLINALQDKDVGRRRAAAMAMQHVLPAVEDPQMRARAVEPLVRAMKDADPQVRGFAPVALGKIGQPALEPLLRIVLEQDTEVRWDWVTRSVAALALREIVGTGNAPASKETSEVLNEAAVKLTATLNDHPNPWARALAAEILGEIGPRATSAVPALLNAARDKHDDVRKASVSALERVNPASKAMAQVE